MPPEDVRILNISANSTSASVNVSFAPVPLQNRNGAIQFYRLTVIHDPSLNLTHNLTIPVSVSHQGRKVTKILSSNLLPYRHYNISLWAVTGDQMRQHNGVSVSKSFLTQEAGKSSRIHASCKTNDVMHN